MDAGSNRTQSLGLKTSLPSGGNAADSVDIEFLLVLPGSSAGVRRIPSRPDILHPRQFAVVVVVIAEVSVIQVLNETTI